MRAPETVEDTAESSSKYTTFRLAEKHYKNRSDPRALPSLLDCEYAKPLVDLSRPEKQEDDEVWRAGWWGPKEQRVKKGKARARGERPSLDYSHLKSIRLADGKKGYIVSEGCLLAPLYLGEERQIELLEAALSRYTLPPNPLSLSTHYSLPPNLFELYGSGSDAQISPLASTANTHEEEKREYRTPDKSRTVIETEPAHVVGYEEVLARNKEWKGDAPSTKLKSKTASDLMREVRWANLGWVYQWSTKAYDFRPDTPIEFPPELATYCSKIVADVPWRDVYQGIEAPEGMGNWTEDYKPDTGIVNFYQLNDTLMGHVDRAELDPTRPLVSISIGHASVFLLGSSSRDDSPTPIILRSGDVIIMSGKSRQSYHGIPRILEGTLPAHFEVRHEDDPIRQAAKKWIQTARININTRQVFPPGFKRS